MFPAAPQGLLDQVHKVGRAELAQGDQRVGTGVNCLVEHLLGQSAQRRISFIDLASATAGSTDSGTAGATMAMGEPPLVVLHGDVLAAASSADSAVCDQIDFEVEPNGDASAGA